MEYRSISERIKLFIETSRYPNYSQWRVGLTHFPSKSKKYWDNPLNWTFLGCNSLCDAEEIEQYFIHQMGMTESTCVSLSRSKTVYIYIFKHTSQ